MAGTNLAAVLPTIEAVAPSIITLITALVHKAAPAAEIALGPSTGPVKFAQVFGDVVTSLTSAANAGQIPLTLPSDPAIQVIIQAVVSSMKLAGLLDAPVLAVAGTSVSVVKAPASPNSSVAYTIQHGQTFTITAA